MCRNPPQTVIFYRSLKQMVSLSKVFVWIPILLVALVGFAILGYYSREAKFSYERYMAVEGFSTEAAEPQGVEASLLAPVMSTSTEKLVASDTLVPQSEEEAIGNWSNMTSERCFRRDMAEPLMVTGNYLQRTNNYKHSYPDSCSAPNHEFVGTFYRPHEGIGSTPKSGLPLPPSTQCI
jgi:hypothetical protein